MDFSDKRSYRGKIKLVILDWSGTIMDYGCYAPTIVFIEVFRKKGIELSTEQARRPMGLHKREHIKAIANMPEIALKWENLYHQKIREQDIDELFANFKPLQLQCLADYADLIPGTLETVQWLHTQGITIGTTTGFFSEALDVIKIEAARQGYVPDYSISASQVRSGRPEPWMVFLNMINTGIYPPAAVVKIDDTQPGIEEGINANTWTIAVAKTGNEMGLSLTEINNLSDEKLETMLKKARANLARTGAHYVIDSIAEVPAVIESINMRLSRGERP